MVEQTSFDMNLKPFSVAPNIKPPQAPASTENPSRLDMAYMNLDSPRRQSQDATKRSYAKQGGGGPSTSMQINQSSGPGGGGGGNQYGSGEEGENKEDRAEVSAFGEDSPLVSGRAFQKAREERAISLDEIAKICPFIVRIYLPFSLPILLN